MAERFTDAWDLLSGLSLQRMAETPCQAITTMEAECPGSPTLSHIAGIRLDGTETTQGEGHMAAHITSLCLRKPKDDDGNSFSHGPDALLQMARRGLCEGVWGCVL